MAFLTLVAQTRQPEVEAVRPEPFHEPPDVRRPAHRHDRNAVSVEISSDARRERLDRDLIADAFDEHNRVHGLNSGWLASDENDVERRYHSDEAEVSTPCVPCRHCWEHQPLDRNRLDLQEGRAWHRCRRCQEWYLVRWEDAVALQVLPVRET